jgi:hypothetical protein
MAPRGARCACRRTLSADERIRWRREQERDEIDRTALAKRATSPGYRSRFARSAP